jgi:excinuclease ABC subunit C
MLISQNRYERNIEMAHQILRGHFSQVLKEMKEDMMQRASQLDFEGAQEIKEKIDRLYSYRSRSTVAGGRVVDADVFSIVSDSLSGYVNYMHVVQGSVIQSYTMEMKKCMDESDEELLQLAVVELRERFSSTSREVLLSIPLDIELGEGVKTVVPQKGERRLIVELSEKNARMARAERLNKERITDPEAHTTRLMQTMQEDLRLDRPPRHIECFDNSNIQGTNAVSSCVVFRDGRPSKKDYRHFNVRTVVGADDFATMAEVITRRYTRMINEGESLPDLIIVDGGKGQLSSAYEILCRLGIEHKVKIIGIAKRLEELFYPDDPIPLYLDRRSMTLRVIQQLRDEAHRFGITHHRNRRSKAALTSELDDIKGVGEKTKENLLRVFRTVDAIREASREELEAVVGAAKAGLIIQHYKSLNDFI